MTNHPGFLSVRAAATLAGLSYRNMLDRLNPDHPDTVPSLKYENRGGKFAYRIPEDDFNKWLEAHKVQP